MTHGSLFSGIGGFDIAAEWAGIKNIFSCEVDGFCNQLLKIRFPLSIHHNDIRNADIKQEVDIISMGFPCQDISISGTGKGIDGGKSGLWREAMRIIRDIRPKYVIVENSSAILVSRGFERLLCEFSAIGYNGEWQSLQGNQFGTPQRRRRMYAIFYSSCIRNGIPQETVYTRWSSVKPSDRWNTEDRIYRMANDIPNRLDRHRALGNAVQPVLAYYLFECIKHHYKKFLLSKEQNVQASVASKADSSTGDDQQKINK